MIRGAVIRSLENEAEVFKLFSKFGRVLDVRLIKDRAMDAHYRYKDFAFV